MTAKKETEPKTPLDNFLKNSPPSIDSVRDEAARCADETAKWLRGERGPIRTPDLHLVPEFSSDALGVAAEIAMIVGDALKEARAGFTSAICWATAAEMLRHGWQRGHRLVPHIVGRQPAS